MVPSALMRAIRHSSSLTLRFLIAFVSRCSLRSIVSKARARRRRMRWRDVRSLSTERKKPRRCRGFRVLSDEVLAVLATLLSAALLTALTGLLCLLVVALSALSTALAALLSTLAALLVLLLFVVLVHCLQKGTGCP
jgi:hypothetical protein